MSALPSPQLSASFPHPFGAPETRKMSARFRKLFRKRNASRAKLASDGQQAEFALRLRVCGRVARSSNPGGTMSRL
jgi:hypothetical protein